MRERLVLVASALAALAALVPAAGTTATTAPPASPGGIPRRVHLPEPWLPGTDATGPPGPVAVLQELAHVRARWLSLEKGPALLAVSADGDYAYLDLPHWQPGSHATLSPDGRYVAWFELDEPGPGVPSRTLGLYDTSSGMVRHRRLPDGAASGLLPDAMLWGPGSSVLVVPSCVTRLPGNAGCESHPPTLVSVRDGRATDGRRLALTDGATDGAPEGALDGAFVSGGDLGWGPDVLLLVTGPGHTLQPVDPATAGPGRHPLLLGDRPMSEPVLSPHGSMVAFLDPTSRPGRLWLATVPARPAAGGAPPARPVTSGWSVYAVVGWRDEGSVVVLGSRGRRVAVLAVDTRTGAVTPYLTLDRPLDHAPGVGDSPARDQLQLARDLLTRPQPAGSRPAHRSDPRLVLADVVLALGLLAALTRDVVRRRARRRTGA